MEQTSKHNSCKKVLFFFFGKMHKSLFNTWQNLTAWIIRKQLFFYLNFGIFIFLPDFNSDKSLEPQMLEN